MASSRSNKKFKDNHARLSPIAETRKAASFRRWKEVGHGQWAPATPYQKQFKHNAIPVKTNCHGHRGDWFDGAHPCHEDKSGYSGFHPTREEERLFEACRTGDLNEVKRLLHDGVDINIYWAGSHPGILTDRASPLHVATIHKKQAVAIHLIKAGANVNLTSRDRRTPLHEACYLGLMTVVKELLHHGASVNAKDSSADSPLHCAARCKESSKLEVIDALIHYGASLNARWRGMTPLHVCCCNGGFSEAKKLLRYGADANATDARDSTTPLHQAATQGQKADCADDYPATYLVHCLLKFRAKVNVKADFGIAPLHCAAEWGNVEIVESLLKHGADVNVQDVYGTTALHIAAERHSEVCEDGFSESMRLVEKLLEYGSNVNATDCSKDTPLHYASLGRDVELVKLLVKSSAEVNAQNDTFASPLHAAALCGNREVCKVLLDNGASPFMINNNGNRPVDLAEGEVQSVFAGYMGDDLGGLSAQDLTDNEGSTLKQNGESSQKKYEELNFKENDDDVTSKEKDDSVSKDKNGPPLGTTVNSVRPISAPIAIRVTPPAPTTTVVHDVPFRWEKGREIGRGGFGLVFKCRNLDSGESIALKELSYIQYDKKRLMKEISILQSVHHPNITEYLGSDDDEANNRLLLFMEYLPGGSIADWLAKEGAMDENTCSKYTKQILLGLTFLHNKAIIHRDIKGANILLDSCGTAKIGDLGISKCLDLNVTGAMEMTRDVGTPKWTAPEVLKDETYGRKCDIWSLGCTIVEMLTKHPPFHGMNRLMFYVTAPACNYGPPYQLPENSSDNVKDFLDCCFREPKSRSQAEDLFKLPFVRR